MIERYTLAPMGNLWTDAYKFKTWLDVEIAVCEAQAELGHIPADAVAQIKAKAKFDPQRVAEIEAEVRHDVIAFLTNVNEHVGDAGRYIHLGLTSSDVLDTGLALQLVASLTLIQEQLEYLIQAVRHRAQEHRYTVMVGRSHGIHAEPITFGFKLAGWLAELLRHRDRLCQLQRTVAVGKISGAVGTYANVDPRVEAIACQNWDCNRIRLQHRSFPAIAMPTMSKPLLCWGQVLSALPLRFAIYSAPMSSKSRNFSLRDKKAPRLCPTNAIPFALNG